MRHMIKSQNEVDDLILLEIGNSGITTYMVGAYEISVLRKSTFFTSEFRKSHEIFSVFRNLKIGSVSEINVFLRRNFGIEEFLFQFIGIKLE